MDKPAAVPRTAPPTTPPSDTAEPDDDGAETTAAPEDTAASEDTAAPDDTAAEDTAAPDDTADAGDGEPTESPKRPTAEDRELLAFAQSLELTARDLYDAAIAAGVAEGDLANVFTALRENHDGYANVLSGLLGVRAPQRRDDTLYDERIGGFESGDLDAVVEAAIELEATAVATHTELVGQVVGLDGATRLAAIVVVEARHGTVLAHIAGGTDDLDALLTAEAEPLQPAGNGG